MNGGKTSTTPSMVENVMKVRILVVDDDRICLAVTASVLKLFNYDVVTINCPLEALSTLRMNPDSFDIVLSDVHMPLMNGLNFQRIVELEFQIPVILMSADDKRKLLLKSLENGAAFFIVKPPSISDLKNIWQYVISRKKSTSTNSHANDVEPCNSNNNLNDDVFPKTTSYVNNEPSLSPDHQKQSSSVEKVENTKGKSTSRNSKKPKLIWTSSLHNKFLEAMSVIGTSRAVPKKILEYMNVPGLTRENIASHLQKYRIYVRRLNDSNVSMQHGMPMNWNERPFRSSFSWSQFPTLANNSFLLKYSNNINHSQQQEEARASIPNYGSQGLSLVNSQQNSFLQPNTPFVPSSMNNLGATANYNNSNRSMNILESSILEGQNNQNNKNYDAEGDFTSATVQYMSHFTDTNPNKFERNNNGPRETVGMTRHAQDQETQSFLTNPNSNIINIFDMSSKHGFMGPRQPYFDGGLSNLVNDNTQVLGLMRHNNVVDNQFREQHVNTQTNFNNNMFSEQLSNITTNVQVDNMSNMSDISVVGQHVVAGNTSNATLQSQAAVQEKDMSTTKVTSALAAPQQDWAPNQLDDFHLEYGMEDISAIFSNIDAQNGNNNN